MREYSFIYTHLTLFVHQHHTFIISQEITFSNELEYKNTVTSNDGGECDTPFGQFDDSNCNVTKYPSCDLKIWLRAKCAIDDDDPYLSNDVEETPHLLNPNTEVNGHRVMILECETGYTFVNDTRTDFYCNTTSNSSDILDRTERCNTIPDVCWRSTPCPPNSDGESVEKGCTCRTGYLGAVYATMVFPYFEGGCVYDDPDPCNVSDIVLPLGASTSEAFCGEGIVQIESGDVCVPHCDDDFVPNKDFILCQDTQFLDIDTLRCVRKCDAPVNVSRGVSDPCNEGLKIDPSISGSESFCT